MKIEVVTQYPAWYFIFCAALGVLYAGIAYYRQQKNSEITRTVLISLFSFRSITVTILSFLLLLPFIKSTDTQIEKPVLIIAADNSRSMLAGGLENAKQLKSNLQALHSVLAEDFDVRVHTFGDKIKEGDSLNFSDKSTNFSQLFEDLESRYANKNIGALTLLSDGIYNAGKNPIYANTLQHVPIFTVVVGDTAVRKDVFIKELYFNNITYLGNEFPVEITIDAAACNNEKTTLSLSIDGVVKQEISLTLSKLPLTQKLMLKAEKSGMHKISVQVKAVRDEKILINNSREAYLEVLDGRQKILLLSKSSHPDIGAIKTVVEANKNYKVDVQFYDGFKGNLSSYNMVVLHELPDDIAATERLLKSVDQQKIGILLILGTQLKYQQMGRINIGIHWQNFGAGVKSFNDAYPLFQKNFSLFNLTQGTQDFLKDVAPLKVPFSAFSLPGDAENLALQKIGSVATGAPLLSFYNIGQSKIALLAGEGIWRWKLSDYLKNQSEEHFEELIQKTIQYLSLKSDKSNFRIKHPKKFSESDDVVLDAELYNDSYELNNNADIKLRISNESEKVFQYVFDKNGDKYHINLGTLNPGNYRYEASTNLGSKAYAKKGVFVVEELKLEEISTRADAALLTKLALENNGQVFYLSQINALAKAIKERNDIKPVEHARVDLKELVHQKWMFFLIILLLSAEWLIRKRSGLS